MAICCKEGYVNVVSLRILFCTLFKHDRRIYSIGHFKNQGLKLKLNFLLSVFKQSKWLVSMEE